MKDWRLLSDFILFLPFAFAADCWDYVNLETGGHFARSVFIMESEKRDPSET